MAIALVQALFRVALVLAVVQPNALRATARVGSPAGHALDPVLSMSNSVWPARAMGKKFVTFATEK